MRFAVVAACLAAGGLFALPSGASGQTDLVYLVTSPGTSSAPKRGTIVAMTPNEVKLDMSGVAQSFQVNEIKQLKFADEPTPLENARNALAQKNYNSVLTELDKLDVNTLKRDFEKQEVAFIRAFCQAQRAMTEGGDKEAAKKALIDFVAATNRNHYRFYQAAETIGDLVVASGKFDEAAKYYGDTGLGGAPWPEYKLRANLALGRAFYLGGKFDEALKSYEAVLATEIANPETNALKQFALAGKGACLAENGNPDQGIALVKDVIKVNDPQQDKRLFAYANNALGNCYLKANRPKEALLAFLQTHLLFFGDADTHGEALFHLAKLADSLNQADIASDARNALRQRYAGSYWLARQ